MRPNNSSTLLKGSRSRCKSSTLGFTRLRDNYETKVDSGANVQTRIPPTIGERTVEPVHGAEEGERAEQQTEHRPAREEERRGRSQYSGIRLWIWTLRWAKRCERTEQGENQEPCSERKGKVLAQKCPRSRGRPRPRLVAERCMVDTVFPVRQTFRPCHNRRGAVS